MLDRFGREITYLRVSVIDRCNLACTYCRGHADFVPRRHEDILRYEEIRDVVCEAAALGIWKVRLTGGEPLVRRDIETLVGYVAAIPGIRETAMTTNGVLLASKACILKDCGLDRINISLDTLDPRRYTELTGGGDIRAVLKGIAAAAEAGFTDTKINMVVMPDTVPDEIERLRAFCRDNGLQLQLISRFALHEQKADEPGEGCDRPPPCADCNKIRMLADGTLKPCLFTDCEIAFNRHDIRGSLIRAIEAKPACGETCRTRAMHQIGG